MSGPLWPGSTSASRSFRKVLTMDCFSSSVSASRRRCSAIRLAALARTIPTLNPASVPSNPSITTDDSRTPTRCRPANLRSWYAALERRAMMGRCSRTASTSARKESTLRYRRSGSCSIACRITVSRSGSSLGTIAEGRLGGCSSTRRMTVSIGPVMSCGSTPVTISYRITPKAYTSARESIASGFARSCSGEA